MKTEFKNMADRRLVIHKRMTGRLLCVYDADKLSVSEILLSITGAMRRFAFGYSTHVSGIIQRYIQYSIRILRENLRADSHNRKQAIDGGHVREPRNASRKAPLPEKSINGITRVRVTRRTIFQLGKNTFIHSGGCRTFS